MLRPIRLALCSLGFLTRLGPALMVDDDDFIATTPYAVFSGLVLGFILVLPVMFLFVDYPWIQAWLSVVLNIYLTRGLHYDGLSDVADAAGNHLQKERFWEILKDSHIGAFGVMAVICVVVGQLLFYHEFYMHHAFFLMVWAFPFSRFCGILFSFLARKYVRPTGSGRPFYLGATKKALFTTFIFVFTPAFLFFPIQYPLAALGFALVLFKPLLDMVRKVDGANGDFIGCAMLLGELSAGLGFLMAMQFGSLPLVLL